MLIVKLNRFMDCVMTKEVRTCARACEEKEKLSSKEEEIDLMLKNFVFYAAAVIC